MRTMIRIDTIRLEERLLNWLTRRRRRAEITTFAKIVAENPLPRGLWTYRECLDLYFSIPIEQRAEAEWVVSFEMEETLRRIRDTSGRPVYTIDPLNRVPSFLGRRVTLEPWVERGIQIVTPEEQP